MLDGMRKGLRRWAAGGILLRELRGIRFELKRLADLQERLLALQYPQAPMGAEQVGPSQLAEDPVRVSYVTDVQSAEFAEIELGLTRALGQPPDEDQIMAEYERRHGRQDV